MKTKTGWISLLCLSSTMCAVLAYASEVGWKDLSTVVKEADIILVGKVESWEGRTTTGVKPSEPNNYLKARLKEGEVAYTHYSVQANSWSVRPTRVIRGDIDLKRNLYLVYEERNVYGVILTKEGKTEDYLHASVLYSGSGLELKQVVKVGDEAIFLVKANTRTSDKEKAETMTLLRIEMPDKEDQILRQVKENKTP